MTTFVLHFLGTDGRTTGAVQDSLVGGLDAADFECRHATTARKHAVEAARLAECDVLVSRLIDGEPRPAYVIDPRGGRRNPPGSVAVARENCTKDSGRPCFCSACRAERRERRRA